MKSRLVWYAAVLAGTLPVLVIGIVASFFSNKVLFALWGLFAASLYTLFLRWGMSAHWNPWFTSGRSLLILAFSLTLLGRLVTRYGDELDVGARAALGDLYRPVLTQVQSAYTVAIVVAVAGTLCVLIGRGSTTSLLRPPTPPGGTISGGRANGGGAPGAAVPGDRP